MPIILFLLVIIFSSILSFFSSGVEHLVTSNIKNWSMIPLGYYFLGYVIILFGVYRLRFKKISHFKIYLLRILSRLNNTFNNFDNKVKFDKVELTGMQEKSIRVWNSLLKNKTTILNSNIPTHKRSIQRGRFLATLRQADGVLTLMDTEMNLFYEIFIPHKFYEEMASVFDKEQDKRMSFIEVEKRSELEDVMMKLL